MVTQNFTNAYRTMKHRLLPRTHSSNYDGAVTMLGHILLDLYAWDMNHRPDWEAAEVVESEPHYCKRRVLEAIWIQKTPHNCNLDCGLTLNGAWSAFIQ